MNILLVCHVYPPEHAPAGVMVRELAENLTHNGHNVTILTGWPHHPQGKLYDGWKASFHRTETDPAGFRVIRCGHTFGVRKGIAFRMLYYFTFAISTLFNGLRAGRTDAVLCLSTPIFGSWTACLLAKLKRANFLYSIFDLHPESALHAGLLKEGTAYRLLRRWDTRLCKWSDSISTLSESMRQAIIQRGVTPDKVAVVPFWLDEKRISPRDRDNPWRREQGIPSDKFVALYAGTIGYISGAEIIVQAASLLKDREDILLLMVGEGVGKEKIMELAKAIGLTNLRFLPFQPEEVLPDVQATADAGLVSLLPDSGNTSIPSKVLGYMAAGRPVVASVPDDSGTADMIRSAKCGLVTPPQDAQTFADAITQLADNRADARQKGANARSHMRANYSRATCCDKYERLLAEENVTIC
jgi:colanic acid biosynthesis glycosyl transferase WcaI